jgi:hypothetical protein
MLYNLSNQETLAVSNLKEAVDQCLEVNKETLKELLTLRQEDAALMTLQVRLCAIKNAIERQEETLQNFLEKAEKESQNILSTGNFN